jgi:5-methyltetrahydropteroyltriglutamate--homocysteine methyltransferase
MKRSSERILTTHTGSLPRPPQLRQTLVELDNGQRPDPAEFDSQVSAAVDEIVAHQVQVGVDTVNDGEMSKVSYSTYVTERLSGFGGRCAFPTLREVQEFPEWGHASGFDQADQLLNTQTCIGDVAYVNREPLETDLANLKRAVEQSEPHDSFMSAASPGVISLFLENRHYPSHEAYIGALADAMKIEYDAIHEAGFVLQLDCPDLAVGRHVQAPDASLSDWKKMIELHVEAINAATRDIPPEQLRMHLCWGNYEGPHNHDVPLGEIIGIVLRARPSAISFEAANPRHEHEWRVFEDIKLPDEKVLLPGVIDSTTNYVEHPELVAQRLINFAGVVGRERVMASSDCGFGTFAGLATVASDVTFAKLAAMAEGARLASGELWHGQPAHARLTAV